MATTPASLDSLRRQLEGRWACIERSRECYDALTRRLASFQWERALRGQPELLTQARKQEAELTEVLAYMEHRARLEQWTPDHPGRGVLDELRTRRARLEALARKRLAGLLSRQGESLPELLERLEALALEPEARPLQPDAPVLLEGAMRTWPGPGRFWLTPERLVWRPWFLGHPVQLKPESLTPEDLARLPSSGQGKKLRSMLELCHQLARHRHEPPQELDLVTAPMYWHHPDYPSDKRWGLGVYWRSELNFLPVREPPLLERLKRFVGFEVRRPEPELRGLEALMVHLRRLPSGEFGGALWQFLRARSGVHSWPSRHLVRFSESGEELQLQAPVRVLVVPGAKQRNALHAALERDTPEGEVPANSWSRHYKEKLGILLGAAFAYAVPFVLPSAVSWVASLVGHGVSYWSSARYAKAKGRPWWLGVLFALMCTPIGALLLFFVPKKKSDLWKHFDPYRRG